MKCEEVNTGVHKNFFRALKIPELLQKLNSKSLLIALSATASILIDP